MQTIDDFRARLVIDKHRLDDELEIHAELMDRISKRVAALNRQQMEMKSRLARVEARLLVDARLDDPKASAPVLAGAVERHRSRIEAWDDYQAAREEHEEWAGLLAAWVSRGYSIKSLVDLYGMQYFAIDSAAARSPRHDDRDQRSLRSAIREAGGREANGLRRRPMT